MNSNELQENLTVLVVEDNAVNRRTMELVLEQMVGKVFSASNAIDGLELFRSQVVDIVFTDLYMPDMDGLELAKIILAEKPDTPIVMVTGHSDSDVVISALNNGVAHFLSKPVTRKSIKRALDNTFHRVLVKKLEHETRLKDLELLRFKERYHSLQEKNAFEKQLNLIKNDFQGEFIEKSENSYFINTFYKPLDTLSGDGYSIRKLFDGSIFIFVIDSMGKGISASVTTFMSIAYINHIIDKHNRKRSTNNLKPIIEFYIEYIKKVLLEEEIISCAFIRLCNGMSEMEYSMFSVPAFAVSLPDGLCKIKSNNPPLMAYTTDFNVGSLNVSGMYSLAMFTDGLLENQFIAMPQHKEMLYDLIKYNHPFMHMATFLGKTVSSYDDDLTFVYINSSHDDRSREISITPNFAGVMDYINSAEGMLKALGLRNDDAITMTVVLTELVMNAFEHGCLEIDLQEKTDLITQGMYDIKLEKSVAAPDKYIKVRTLLEDRGGSLVFCAEVSDNGKGFDFRKKAAAKKALFGGNGIRMVTAVVDNIYFNEKGNKVRVYKTIRGECSWK